MTSLNQKISEYKKTLVCLVPKPGSDSVITCHEKTLCDCQVLEIIEGYEKLQEKLDVATNTLIECKDFCQDQLARANQAIETDCDKCDYQCGGCIRSIDDCESTKKKTQLALNKIRGDK